MKDEYTETRYRQIDGELRPVSADYGMRMGNEQDWMRALDIEARQAKGDFKIRLKAAIPNKVREVFMNRALANGYDPIGEHYGVNV